MKKNLGVIPSIARIIIYSTLLSLFLHHGIGCSRFQVSGPSMLPGIRDGGSIIVLWGVGSPGRGDIVGIHVPYAPGYKGPINLIKRVIGLPGDKVKLALEGDVYVNEERVNEPYVAKVNRCLYSPKEFTLGPDEYWVMGDNRAISLDSRVIGPVKKAQIYQKLGCWFQVGGAAQELHG